jgi:hypothetical protein
VGEREAKTPTAAQQARIAQEVVVQVEAPGSDGRRAVERAMAVGAFASGAGTEAAARGGGRLVTAVASASGSGPAASSSRAMSCSLMLPVPPMSERSVAGDAAGD